MELDELKQTWSEHARKVDRVLSLNLESFKTAQLDKTRSALDRFKLYLTCEMLVGFALLLGSGAYIADRVSVPTLAIPALIFAVSVLAAVIGDIHELALLGQISYAELYVSDVLWPDFAENDLHDAIRSFAARNRRFGALDQTNTLRR